MSTGSSMQSPPESLAAKLAQLIMVRIGSNLPPVRTVADDEDRVAALLEICPIGGLLLFNGGTAASEVLARLQRLSDVPLLVAADIERGVGQQCKGYSLFPHAMAFDRLGGEAAAAVGQFAHVLADEALDVGIHITFGPVADVNTNPRNPIIATRAFGEDPQRAAELSAAYIAAAEAAGLRTTAKHFPGHGDTHQDSHDSLPAVLRSLSELEACEVVPFKTAIEAGCSLVMTAHVAYPELDPSGLPATLSPMILQSLLRDKLGFGGVICSDSLLMAGVRDRFASEGEMALAALAAGVDLLLDVHDPAAVVSHLVASVKSGALSSKRVDEAFGRVWSLNERVFRGEAASAAGQTSQKGLGDCCDWKVNQVAAVSSRKRLPIPYAHSLARQVAQGAIQIIGESQPSALPFDPAKPLVAVLLKPFATALDPPEQPLAGALRSRFRDVRYIEIGPSASEDDIRAAEEVARIAKQLLVAMIVKPAAWHAFGLLPPQKAFVERLSRERDFVLASLGVPYAFDQYPDARVRICTYSDVPVSQQALAEYLAGANES
jgi:beta-N-acetylhexosaminidase